MVCSLNTAHSAHIHGYQHITKYTQLTAVATNISLSTLSIQPCMHPHTTLCGVVSVCVSVSVYVHVCVCVRLITLQAGHGFLLWSGQCVCLTNNAYIHTHTTTHTHTHTHAHVHRSLELSRADWALWNPLHGREADGTCGSTGG